RSRAEERALERKARPLDRSAGGPRDVDAGYRGGVSLLRPGRDVDVPADPRDPSGTRQPRPLVRPLCVCAALEPAGRRRAVIVPGLIMHMSSFLLLAFATSPMWLWTAAVIGGAGVGAAQPALMTL